MTRPALPLAALPRQCLTLGDGMSAFGEEELKGQANADGSEGRNPHQRPATMISDMMIPFQVQLPQLRTHPAHLHHAAHTDCIRGVRARVVGRAWVARMIGSGQAIGASESGAGGWGRGGVVEAAGKGFAACVLDVIAREVEALQGDQAAELLRDRRASPVANPTVCHPAPRQHATCQTCPTLSCSHTCTQVSRVWSLLSALASER